MLSVLLSIALVGVLAVTGAWAGTRHFVSRVPARSPSEAAGDDAESLGPVEEETAGHLASLAQQAGKPLIVQSLYTPLRPPPLVTLRRHGIPTYVSIETAVSCLAAVVQYAAATRRITAGVSDATPPAAVRGARAILDRSRAEGRPSLLEHEARALLRTYGVDLPPDLLIRTPAELASAVKTFGDVPLVMKVVSKDVLHKSDAGGVRLGLVGEPALRAAFDDIMRSVRAHAPGAEIEGVLVCPEAPKGLDVVIGVSRDAIFGPVMMFGLGGIFVEVLGDVVFRALPLGSGEAEDMLDGLRARDVLMGARGRKPVDRRALVDLMLKASTLALAHPEISEIDLNPVIAYADGCAVVDARMITLPT